MTRTRTILRCATAAALALILALGALLAAVIGLPGLALYLGARAAGLNTTVVASGLSDHWWVVPVLVLAAQSRILVRNDPREQRADRRPLTR